MEEVYQRGVEEVYQRGVEEVYQRGVEEEEEEQGDLRRAVPGIILISSDPI